MKTEYEIHQAEQLADAMRTTLYKARQREADQVATLNDARAYLARIVAILTERA